MKYSARRRFLDYVRNPRGKRPIVSPFLPHDSVIREALVHLGLKVTGDSVKNEVSLALALDYEPMFMVECAGLIFPWEIDEDRSDDAVQVRVIRTPEGDWENRLSVKSGLWGGEKGFPVQTEADHEKLQMVCRHVKNREAQVREFYREWRRRVGEDGVIVIGHPNPAWLAHQISQAGIFLHWHDFNEAYRRSMEAIYRTSLFVMEIALEEGIDFMSASGLGLEMTSPDLFREMDLPVLRAYVDWTHKRGGLFWYHNCGQTRKLIRDGLFNAICADVIETLSPPPNGDNDLAESRSYLDPAICTKGNLDLGLLREGTPDLVTAETRKMVEASRGFAHIFSTADAVLPGTPPENLIALVRTVRQEAEGL